MAGNQRDPGHRTARALRFTERAIARRLSGVTLDPVWLDGDRFWFATGDPDGSVAVVDPAEGTVRMADVPPTATRSPTPEGAPSGVSRSPDGRWELCRRDGNLILRAAGTAEERGLTIDAEPWWDYGGTPDTSTIGLTLRRSGAEPAPVALWAPDSKRVLTHRIDQRRVRELPLVESAPDDGVAPVPHPLRVPWPGDAELPSSELVAFDVPDGERIPVPGPPLPVEFYSPLELGWVWWGVDDDQIWYLAEGRGARSLALWTADLGSGHARKVLEESDEHYVEPHPLLPWPSSVRLVPGAAAVIWPSERDGWRHLYLYDTATGELIRQLTSGPWVVRDVLRVGEGWVWFTGLGREPGRDPYLRHLYRVPLAGGDPELLTPEEGDHRVTISPSGRYFLDTASTIRTAPVHQVRRSSGDKVCDLGSADLSALEEEGWMPPEPFSVLAADGATALYGALFFPSDFDPALRYPVVDAIYRGPQLMRTPKSFTVDSTAGPDEWPGAWEAQAVAELGFVVMTVDGRGTPLRSRQFHHHSYGRLGGHGLDDHIAALRELGSSLPYLDLHRMGIFGHSGGGAAAARAVIEHPEVFKVAVAGSGVHDLRRYLAYWAEKYQGLGPDTDYREASNIDLADRLTRPLLLIHGELDDNVHPSNTFADALIRADRGFELVVLPGQNHSCATHPYYQRRLWEFLRRHLGPAERPDSGREGVDLG